MQRTHGMRTASALRGALVLTVAVAIALAALAPCSTARAVNSSWNKNTSGAFASPANWTAGVPEELDDFAFFERTAAPTYAVSFPANAVSGQVTVNYGTVSFESSISGAIYSLRNSTGGDGFQVGTIGGVTTVLNLKLPVTEARTVTIAGPQGSDATLNLSQPASYVTISNSDHGYELRVGRAGVGALNISGGAQLFLPHVLDGASIGYEPTARGAVPVSGVDSLMSVGGEFSVGTFGNGAVQILAAAKLVTDDLSYVGDGTGAVGAATISGAGSRWTYHAMSVGRYGAGTLSVLDGATVVPKTSNGSMTVGFIAGSNGTASIGGAGSTLNAGIQLYVGYDGRGTINVADAGRLTSGAASLGYQSGSKGRVNIAGSNSKWQVAGELVVGSAGDGGLAVTQGGQVTSGTAIVGGTPTGLGAVTVSGVGSLWTNAGALTIGQRESEGSIVIEAGGQVQTAGASIGADAIFGGQGIATVSGLGSKWTSTGQIVLGSTASYGQLTVADQAIVEAPLVGLAIGGELRGDGTIMGDVQNIGTVAPGTSPGTLTIQGNYDQAPIAVLAIELGSAASYDKLKVTGLATLNGTLRVTRLNGFMPQIGQSFDVLDLASLSGDFDFIMLPTLTAGVWDATNLYTTGVLRVASPYSADFDDDGDVDPTDLGIWKTAFGTSELGDADADNDSDGDDFLIWQRQLGSQPVVAVSGAVPEPGAAFLATTFLYIFRRRRGVSP